MLWRPLRPLAHLRRSFVRRALSLQATSLIQRCVLHADRVAVVNARGGSMTYAQCVAHAADWASKVQGLFDGAEERVGRARVGERVAILCSSDQHYVVATLATWMAGGVAVPLHKGHPPAEAAYIVRQSGASVLMACEALSDQARDVLRAAEDVSDVSDVSDAEQSEQGRAGRGGVPRLLVADVDCAVEKAPAAAPERWAQPQDGALMIYTSGTTGRPKGVMHSHGNVEAMVRGLCAAWAWRQDDRILHFLPLHHVHGIVNKLYCALWAGATVEFAASASPAALWQRLGHGAAAPLTLFMAVPTVYARMLDALEGDVVPAAAREGLRGLRLMVSGSAALPDSLFQRWEASTGHRLLERYGMTEVGMALGNPLAGPRTPGYVGQPFPGVDVRLVDEERGGPVPDGEPGALQLRGPQVFSLGYWRNEEATREAFAEDAWFDTGDVALLDRAPPLGGPPSYRICGRASVDIIKSAGYKVSALEVERCLLEHPNVREAAVLGEEDATWGQVVVAVLALRDDAQPPSTAEELGAFLRDKLADYKQPRRLLLAPSLPRNAMGKVNKKTLLRDLAP